LLSGKITLEGLEGQCILEKEGRKFYLEFRGGKQVKRGRIEYQGCKDRYDGDIKHFMRHGKGTFKDSSLGLEVMGQWEDDSLVNLSGLSRLR